MRTTTDPLAAIKARRQQEIKNLGRGFLIKNPATARILGGIALLGIAAVVVTAGALLPAGAALWPVIATVGVIGGAAALPVIQGKGMKGICMATDEHSERVNEINMRAECAEAEFRSMKPVAQDVGTHVESVRQARNDSEYEPETPKAAGKTRSRGVKA